MDLRLAQALHDAVDAYYPDDTSSKRNSSSTSSINSNRKDAEEKEDQGKAEDAARLSIQTG